MKQLFEAVVVLGLASLASKSAFVIKFDLLLNVLILH